MEFFGYFRSSAAYRCRIAFNLKGIEPTFQPVHLRRNGGEQKLAAFKAVNPQALVPALVTDNGILTQSLAIIEWLDETHPERPLLPKDPLARANVRAFAQAIACDIHPLQNLRVLDYLRNDIRLDSEAVTAWCQRWIGDGLEACEAVLSRNQQSTDFTFGDAPSLADICLVPQLYSADRFKVSLERMPRLRAIRERCEAVPEFASAHPSVQSDSE